MRWRYLPFYSPPSVSMSTRISLERPPRFSIGNFLIKRLSTYFSAPHRTRTAQASLMGQRSPLTAKEIALPLIRIIVSMIPSW